VASKQTMNSAIYLPPTALTPAAAAAAAAD